MEKSFYKALILSKNNQKINSELREYFIKNYSKFSNKYKNKIIKNFFLFYYFIKTKINTSPQNNSNTII